MKWLSIVFFLTVMCNSLLGQTDQYALVMDKFQTNYNEDKFEAVFQSFSPEMQSDLPLKETTEFLSGLKKEVGNIKENTFLKFEVGQTAVFYKTTFEKAPFYIRLSLNKSRQIDGLLIQPYDHSVSESPKIVNALNDLPGDWSEMLFAKTKDFPNGTQWSIAVVDQGKTNYYGILKTNDTVKLVNNHDKIFEIGSITKVFTSTVLASLVEKGKIKLKDNINPLFNYKFKNNEPLNFESLANHTSGLPRVPSNMNAQDVANPYKNYGKTELEEFLKNDMELVKEHPVKSSYSNIGAGLLGYAMGLSQNTTFNELLQKEVLNRYKLKHTYFSSHNLGDKLVKGLDPNGQPTSNWDFDALFAAGGLLSSVEDLAKFAQAQFNEKDKVLALTRQVTAPVSDQMNMGLGWHISKFKEGKTIYWHNGGTGGYTSCLAVDTQSQTAVAVLSNVSAFHPKMNTVNEMCFQLLKSLPKN